MEHKVYIQVILIGLLSFQICFCQENKLQRINQLNTKTHDAIQPQIQWTKELATHAYSSPGSANDAIIDNNGNSYITGNIAGLETDIDFLTIKIDSSGQVVWTSRHDGPLHHRDDASSIAIDSLGNSYVSGLQTGLDITSELTTIKINSLGTNEWTRSYQYHGSFFYRTKIIVDKEGNISNCVPDFSDNTGIFRLIVVQYSPSGTELWNRSIDSCAYLSKILVDQEKNLYLISEYGYSNFSSIIIKLDQTGRIQWKKPIQPMIYDAIIDSHGNLIVTGGSTRDFDSRFFIGEVSQQGDFAWQDQDSINTATSGRALIEDHHNGYCVSALPVNGGSNVIVFRYDSLGHRSWSYLYNNFQTDISSTTHISISKTDDIFVGTVTWNDNLLLRISNNGSYIGATTVHGIIFFTGKFNSKNRYYTAGEYCDSIPPNQRSGFAASLFSSNGNIERTTIYHDSTNSMDNAVDMIYDPSGFLYICGTAAITNTEKQLALWKLGTNGALIWYTSIHDTAKAVNECRMMQRDASGNLFLLSDHYQNVNCFYISKIDSTGNILWSKPFGTYSDANKIMRSTFAIDGSGNIYITDYDFCLRKINSSGDIVWSRRCTETNSNYDFPQCTRLGNDGGIYIAGSNLGSDQHLDFILMRYDSSGNQTWKMRYNALNNIDENMAMMIQDDSSNSYCVGSVEGKKGTISNPSDFLITKNGSDGNMKWFSRIDSSSIDQFTNVCIDSKGNIIAIGRTWRVAALTDFAVLKYDPMGNLVWISVPFNFPSIDGDEATQVCCDKLDNIYVLGFTYGTECLDIVQYTPEGTIQWTTTYQGSFLGSDRPAAIKIDNENNLFILETNSTDKSSTIQALKINPGVISTIKGSQQGTLLPSRLSVQCWPNPFNPTINISYYLPERTKIFIKVFNLLGQEVDQLVNDYQQAGEHSIKWSANSHYASGVYFCRISTDRESKVAKIFLMK